MALPGNAFAMSYSERLSGVRLAADGNLWFTETNGNRIGRLVP